MSDPGAYRYDVALLSAEDGGGYLVTFPDVPGCLGVGETLEDAVADGREALFACLDAFRAVDRPPPVPSASPA